MGSAYGTVTKAGAAMIKFSKSNQRRGPFTKNLQPSRISRPHPSGKVGSLTGPIKGPDRGMG